MAEMADARRFRAFSHFITYEKHQPRITADFMLRPFIEPGTWNLELGTP